MRPGYYKLIIFVSKYMAKEKKPVVQINGISFLRIPIKTRVITEKDNIVEVIDEYTHDLRQNNDIIVVSESVVAITQGRAIPVDKIKVGILAKIIWRFVRKVPYGIGLRSPTSMQCAINEVGSFRITVAAIIGGIARFFGRKGDFYRIAGEQAAMIDAAHTSPIEPYNKCVIMGPKDPMGVAKKIKEKIKCDAAVVDVNDIGGSWAVGYTDGINRKLLEDIMRDNPLGQKLEQTPIGIIRKV